MRWNAQSLRSAVETVRRDFADNHGAPSFDWKTTTVFVVTTVLLTVFYYYGKTRFYARSGLDDLILARWGDQLAGHVDMLPYVYWGVMSVVMRVFVPMLLIVLLFRERPRDYGWRFDGQLAHVPGYAALYVAMLPFLFWAASQPSFQARYPFYGPAAEGGAQFWLFEFFYGLQFIGVEFFFRGFLIFALFRKFGYYALLIMAIPYVMIHFNKPVPETLGALVAGVVLGYLALKARSCVLGIALHFGVAITMDFLAISKIHDGVGNAMRAIF